MFKKLMWIGFAVAGCSHGVVGQSKMVPDPEPIVAADVVDDSAADCIDGCIPDCAAGQTRACYGGPDSTVGVGACKSGTQTCTDQGKWDPTCVGEVDPQMESCSDQIDNDCNGMTDCTDGACTVACCVPSDQIFKVTQTPADVLFVVDRSGSMEELAGPTTKWNALQNAVTAVLPGLDSVLRMGLVVFPSDNDCGVDFDGPEVSIETPSANEISNMLGNFDANGETPTFDALTVAQSYFASYLHLRPRFIVLSTDGAPNCNHDATDVAQLIGQLHQQKIDTFVLGIPGDDGSLIAPLNQMADAGGQPRSGANHFYEANDPISFQSSLRGIVAATAGCKYMLAQPGNDPSKVTVTLDSINVIPADATSGWSYTDSTNKQIQFNGTSCEAIKSGNVISIGVNSGC